MKKLFALVLALCLMVGLLPMTAMAEAPAEVKVQFYVAKSTKFTITLKDGDVAFVTTDADKLISKWEDEAEPTDNYAKLEYDAESATVKMTLNNFNADMTDAGGYTCHGIEFWGDGYSITMELVGKNSLAHGDSACLKYHNDGGLTITGAGSLDMIMTGSGCGTIWSTEGDLTIKDTTVNFNVNPGNDSMIHAILSTKSYKDEAVDRNVTIENSKIDAQLRGGNLVFFGEAQQSGDQNGRYSMDTESNCNITIKDCDIVSNTVSAILMSKNPATISNTKWKATTSNAPLFAGIDKSVNAPTIEGEYSAVAGLKKNAEKPDKWKEYNPKKISSYTFFYMEPGKVNLLPEEEPTTEATKPAETKPVETKPVETKPVETKPVETKPVETKPVETKPVETKPVETKPAETKPAETKPVDTDKDTEEESGSPLKVVLIVLIVLLVAAGAAVGVIFYLRNKNAAELEEGEEEEDAEEEAEEETEAETEEE